MIVKDGLLPGERLTKVPTTTRPDHVWQEVWTKIGKAARNLEKQESKNEKSILDSSRRLRGIYFINPDDEEYKEILKYATTKLERPLAAAMPCKKKTRTSNVKVTADVIASRKIPKTISGCVVKPSLPTKHEDHIAGSQIDSYVTSDENSGCKSNRQRMEETETIPTGQLEKVKSRKEAVLEAQRDKKKESPLCHVDGHKSLHNE